MGAKRNITRVPFLRVAYDDACLQDVLDDIDAEIESDSYGYMVSVNLDMVSRAKSNESFREAMLGADLLLMDSMPLMKLAAKLRLPIRQKLSGSDLMPVICNHAARNGYKVFILGGAPGVPEKAADNLKALYPGLKVSGTFSPPFGFADNPEEIADVVRTVASAEADIVFVCLGAPIREYIAEELLQLSGAHYAFCVGAAVDFAAGTALRAPEWMQNAGLEWFYRFLKEPKRLFKRYFVDSWRVLPLVVESVHRR